MADTQPDLNAYLEHMRESLFYCLINNRFSIGTLKEVLVSTSCELARRAAPSIDPRELSLYISRCLEFWRAETGFRIPEPLPGGFRLGDFVAFGDSNVWHLPEMRACLFTLVRNGRYRGFQGEELAFAFAYFVADTLHEVTLDFSIAMGKHSRVNLWHYIQSDFEEEFDTLGKEEYIPYCLQHGRSSIRRTPDGRLECECKQGAHDDD